jgi:hypothetical protein
MRGSSILCAALVSLISPVSSTHTLSSTMSQDQQGSGQQPRSARGSSSTPGRDSSKGRSDEWSEVTDPGERRKIQNKLAQRRFSKWPVVHVGWKGFPNTAQETRSESRRKRTIVRWRTSDEPGAPMLLQNQGTSTKEMSFLGCHGAGSPCGTSWKRERRKSRVPNAVLGKIRFTPPPRVLEGVAGEIPS